MWGINMFNIYKKFKYQQEVNNSIIAAKDEYINELLGIIHDFDVQLNSIKQLIFENKLEKDEAFRYIDQMKENIHATNSFLFVKSKPLQLLLKKANDMCFLNGIEFITDIRYASFEFMSFPDLFSLFENAMDNAINACLNMEYNKHAKFKLQIIKFNKQILIQFSNTYNKNQNHNKLYNSSRITKEHGIGIHNIKKTVRKYHGTISINSEDEFRIMISLPLAYSEKNLRKPAL